MPTRKSFPAAVAGMIAAVMVAPATASAKSFPEKASDYVSDNTGIFVGALLVAILLLLLIMRVNRRRSEEKEQKQAAQPAAGAPGAPPAGQPTPPPGPQVSAATAEMAAVGAPAAAAAASAPGQSAPPPGQSTPPPGSSTPSPVPGQAPPPGESAKDRKQRQRDEQRQKRAQMREARKAELQRRKEERAQRKAQKKGGAVLAVTAPASPAAAAPGAAPAPEVSPQPEPPKQKSFFGIKYGAGNKQKREAALAEQRLAAARAANERAVAEAQAGGPVPPSGQLPAWEEATTAQPQAGGLASVPPPPVPGGTPAPGEYDPTLAEQRVQDKVAGIRNETQRIGAEADRRMDEAARLQQGGLAPAGGPPIQDAQPGAPGIAPGRRPAHRRTALGAGAPGPRAGDERRRGAPASDRGADQSRRTARRRGPAAGPAPG